MKRHNQCISQRYYIYISIAFTLVLTFFLFTPVKSQAASISLGVYPPLIKITTSPNSHIHQDITISNYASDPTIVTISFKMFKPSDKKNGQIIFLANTDKAKNFFSEHVKILDGSIPVNQVLLAPRQHKSLSIDITLPKDQQETDYYISILFISNNSMQTKSNASVLSGGIATNILLSVVPQPTVELGYIKQFTAPRLIDKDPIPFLVEATNQGKHFFAATGKIRIVNMLFGSENIIQLQPAVILSNSSRYLTDYGGNSLSPIEWKHGFLFGIYRADLEMNFGKNPKTFHKTIYFYSYPVLGFGIALIVFIFIGIILFKISKNRG